MPGLPGGYNPMDWNNANGWNPGLPGQFGLTWDDVKQAAGTYGCGSLPQILQAACYQLTGSTPGQQPDPRGENLGGGCAQGYHMDANGQCVADGVVGTGQRWIPGGASGTQNDVYGEAVYGRYGVGLVPGQEMVPTFRCPPGMKLGKDDICYENLTKKERKWPYNKPLLSAGDARTLRRAHAVERKLQRHSMKYLSPAPPKRPRKASKRG